MKNMKKKKLCLVPNRVPVLLPDCYQSCYRIVTSLVTGLLPVLLPDCYKSFYRIVTSLVTGLLPVLLPDCYQSCYRIVTSLVTRLHGLLDNNAKIVVFKTFITKFKVKCYILFYCHIVAGYTRRLIN